MVRRNYRMERFIGRAIRAMKKDYGHDITLYTLNTTTSNYTEGTKTTTADSVYIKRAVVLPDNSQREMLQTISIISANKKMLQGGSFDQSRQTFLIDRDDVPSTWEIKQDDWVVWDGKRYDVDSVEEYHYKKGWIVKTKQIKGNPVYEHHHKKADHYLNLTQTVSAVIT